MCSEDRELNPPRSKPDTVDQPVRTARTIVHHYNSIQYCSTKTVLVIFPFLLTNITSQMCPSKAKGINPAGDLAQHCKLPQWIWAKHGWKTLFWCILRVKVFIQRQFWLSIIQWQQFWLHFMTFSFENCIESGHIGKIYHIFWQHSWWIRCKSAVQILRHR